MDDGGPAADELFFFFLFFIFLFLFLCNHMQSYAIIDNHRGKHRQSYKIIGHHIESYKIIEKT